MILKQPPILLSRKGLANSSNLEIQISFSISFGLNKTIKLELLIFKRYKLLDSISVLHQGEFIIKIPTAITLGIGK